MDFFTGFGFAVDVCGFGELLRDRFKKADSDWNGFLSVIKKIVKLACKEYRDFIKLSPDHKDIVFHDEYETNLYAAVDDVIPVVNDTHSMVAEIYSILKQPQINGSSSPNSDVENPLHVRTTHISHTFENEDFTSTFLFVTANEHERDAFEKKFIRHKEQYILGKTYYLGVFGRYPAAYIHVDEQSVTNPAAMPLVSQLVNNLRPWAVVMVGIAFGADESKQKIGHVLVSDKILPYDSQRLLESKTEYKEIPKEVGFQLLNAFREHREWEYHLPNSEWSKVIIGAILTGSRLVNNYKYRSQLLRDFAIYKPIGGEMEAQGIYSMCRLHGVAEWIIIKGICDWGYKKDTPEKDRDQIIAAEAAVSYCHHVFSRDDVFSPPIRNSDIKDTSTTPSKRIAVNNNGATIGKQVNLSIETMTGDLYL